MYMIIPLAATASILDFNNTQIPSYAHETFATDFSNGSVVWPYRQYKSTKHTPPHLEITHYDNNTETLGEGYIFVTPSSVNDADGTMEQQGTGFVLADNGDLIYAAEEDGMGFCTKHVSGMTDFRAQTYNGRPYILYWNGCNTRGQHWGHRWGRVTFLDEQYEKFVINPELDINTGDPAPIGQIDVHEHELTDDGTIMLSSYNNTPWDLSRVGGPKDGWLAESMFFELDVETQNIRFQWAAADHIPLTNSRMPGAKGASETRPWDWFHINSVQKVGSNYLISSRHCWTAYMISGEDGSVLWQLDGVDVNTDFGDLPPEAHFRWQHHIRAHEVSEDSIVISVFNNFVNGDKKNATQTRGTAVKLSLPPNRRKPVELYHNLHYDKDPQFSNTQGTYTMDLGNGNGFIGYGSLPVVREFSPSGRLLYQARFGYDGAVQSYRGTKQKWHGTPKNWNPNLVIDQPEGRPARAYVSWNGATEIDAWAVYAGDHADTMHSVGVANRHSFETSFDIGDWRCVRVGAIRDGRVLRASNTACI